MTQVITELDQKWHQQRQKLVEFKQKNGHCMVPQGYEQDKSLGQWVSRQRTLYTNNNMGQDRKELLNEIGFVWKADNLVARIAAGRAKGDDMRWRQKYEKLVEFQRKNGHCIVPKVFVQDKALGNWVSAQRKKYASNTLREDRKDLLEALEFVWNVEQHCEWNFQYNKLVEFQRKNGQCIIVPEDIDNQALAIWVVEQRTRCTNNKMQQERKELLDKIGGFHWRFPALAAHSSTKDNVRSIVIGSFQALVRSFIFLTLVLFMLGLFVGIGVGSVHQQCGFPKRRKRKNGTSARSG